MATMQPPVEQRFVMSNIDWDTYLIFSDLLESVPEAPLSPGGGEGLGVRGRETMRKTAPSPQPLSP